MENFRTVSLADALVLFVRVNKLGAGLFRQAVFSAWDKASGAALYSSSKSLKDRVLYVTVSSSVVRSDLAFQLELILIKMNGILDEDKMVKLSGITERIDKIVLR